MNLLPKYLLFFFCFLAILPAEGQRFLQLEKANSMKRFKFAEGDELTYKIKSDPGYWYTQKIHQIQVDDGILVMDIGYVNIDEIIAIKTFKNQDWSKAMGNKLLQFASSWFVYSLGGALTPAGALGWAALTVPLTAISFGLLLKGLFKSKTHRIGKRKRIRLLDLSFPKKPVVKPRT